MSPEWLVAEGPMPGRPSLLGKIIHIKTNDGASIAFDNVRVVEEWAAGIVFQGNRGHGAYTYPFMYKVISDG